MMNQDKTYEIVSKITVRAMERAEKIYTEALARQEKNGNLSGQQNVMEEYAKTLGILASAISATGLLRPLHGFGLGIGQMTIEDLADQS